MTINLIAIAIIIWGVCTLYAIVKASKVEEKDPIIISDPADEVDHIYEQ